MIGRRWGGGAARHFHSTEDTLDGKQWLIGGNGNAG